MKKVLLLAYYFPPRNRTSSFRPGYFAKYLPKQGWNPTVICEDWPQGAKDHDPSFLSEIAKEIEVHRIDSAKPKGLYRFYVRNIAPYLKLEKTPLHWWKKARLKAFELNDRQKFDAIWATYNPLATLMLAAELSSEYSTPWVADLRDSWNVQKIGPKHKRQRIADMSKSSANWRIT